MAVSGYFYIVTASNKHLLLAVSAIFYILTASNKRKKMHNLSTINDVFFIQKSALELIFEILNKEQRAKNKDRKPRFVKIL